jgi:quinol monooxygenase YgiN
VSITTQHPLLTFIQSQLIEPSKPFTLLVSITVKPGKENAFKQAALLVASATLNEGPNIHYEFHQNSQNPQHVMLIEQWPHLAALENHFQQAHTQAILDTTAELAEAQPIVTVFTSLQP